MNTSLAPRQSLQDRVSSALAGMRDWLDERGKPAWIVATILAFILAWPVGLAILGYMIWSKRMSFCRHRSTRHRSYSMPTGNSAFDAYRTETLKRLEDEHQEFMGFLQQLRDAKDKAEFDEFMQKRRDTAA